jgi:hypothetical protein
MKCIFLATLLFREIEKNKFECLECLKIICKMCNILKHLKKATISVLSVAKNVQVEMVVEI